MFQSSHPQPTNSTCPPSAQRSGRVPLPTNPVAHSGSRVRIGTQARTRIALLALLVACAGLPLSAGAADNARAGIRAQGPGAVFDSVEAAALDALAYAHLEATPTDRWRLRVGTIHRTANGYSYAAPKRSAASSPLMAPSVRYRLRAIDVARYVIPPRSGQARIDRLNEDPTRKEKQIVDELDPEHRPLYQLTPSLNVVSYRHGGQTTVVANLNDLAVSKIAASVSEAESAPALSVAPCAIRSIAIFARRLTSLEARDVD